jgi:hypothetical protein
VHDFQDIALRKSRFLMSGAGHNFAVALHRYGTSDPEVGDELRHCDLRGHGLDFAVDGQLHVHLIP